MSQFSSAEIVWVKDEFHLIDAESYERRYRRPANEPLARGYYIVTWPPEAANGDEFDETAEFTGPFKERRAAEEALGFGARAARGRETARYAAER
jgi:hypothetical protein